MFTSAKLKLTLLYLSILLTVTGIFSLVLYQFVSLEIERGFLRIEERMVDNSRVPYPVAHEIVMENTQSAKHSVAIRLLYVNLFIAFASGVASYILASKTLGPIEESVEEQKRFIADASHELRTPLTSLKISTEVALREKSKNYKNLFTTLKSSLIDIEELEKLVNSLLDLSSIQDLKETLPCEKVDLEQIVHKSLKKFENQIRSKGIVVKTSVKSTVLSCNKESISKLIDILLDNAVKYTSEKGEIAIKVINKRRSVVISVTDTGVGIRRKDLDKVFDRFFRSEDSRNKTHSSGHGLGLSIAKRIVDLHDGEISVKSKLDHGTTFFVSLPQPKI